MEKFTLKKEEKEELYNKSKLHIILSQSYSVYLFAIMIAVVIDFIYPISFSNKAFNYVGFSLLVLGSLLVHWAQNSSTKSKREMMERKCPRNFATGPYKLSRRPTQLGLTLATLGFALVSESFFVVFATVLSYFVTRFIFLKYQEKILIERYGDAYCDYRDKVQNVL